MSVSNLLRSPRKRALAITATVIGLGISGLLIAPAPARADTMLWSNGFNAGTPQIVPTINEFDAKTGALVKTFADPAGTPGKTGLGIAVVGSSIYYSVAGSTSVFLTDANGDNLVVRF